MTREEVKQGLHSYLDSIKWGVGEYHEMFGYLLNMLDLPDSAEDCISRQAVIDTIEDDTRNGMYSHFASYKDSQLFEESIRELPSVQPTPKKGKWKRKIVDSGFNADWVCSECGHREMTDFISYNFCSSCGADMRGKAE